MWQFLIAKETYKWLFYGLVAIIIGAGIFYLNLLRKENLKLEKKVFYLEKKLEACQKANADLINQIQIQHETYQKKIDKLLKLANKKPKVIEIPKVITKEVYVTSKECKQMAIMIDEFIKKQKEKER